MIKLIVAPAKTNAFYPTDWGFSKEPFPAYRGSSHTYTIFQPVASSYVPQIEDGVDSQPSKIFTTAKGTKLLVPCSAAEDQRILLLSLKGGFRGGYSRIEAVGNAEIVLIKDGNKHCVPTAHLVVILRDEKAYIMSETGRRSSRGQVEIFSWEGYKSMPTEEYEAWREIVEAA